jgi:hypothetical protein
MTRAPTKTQARKATGKPVAERQPFSFMLPPDLVAEIDAIATEESRSRVRTVEIILRQYVRNHRHQAGTDPLAKHLAPPSPRERSVRGGRAA